MREIGVNEYTLINYFDVWGNKKDGWEVNDQCIEANDLNITDDCTDKELCEYLKERKFLNTSDMRRLEVRDDGNYIEILEKKTQKPLYGLVMNM